MSAFEPIIIGTRGSKLALTQAAMVRDRLVAMAGVEPASIAIEVISTTGDRITDRPLSEIGGKGLFTQELEDRLLDGRLTLAVHSTKDMPTQLPDGLAIAAFLPRDDIRDAFLSPLAADLHALPPGAVVGTASIRRTALVKRTRPDLDVVNFRGNVQTRLAKLADGVVDATLLAAAGLRRLSMEDRITALLEPEDFPPAPGQGAICVELATNCGRANQLAAIIDHPPTAVEIACERAFLAVLDGSCQTPLAGYARLTGPTLTFYGAVFSEDGRTTYDIRLSGNGDDAAQIGADAATRLRCDAGSGFFSTWTGGG